LVASQAFLCSIAIALTLLIAADGGAEIIVETSHATIESKKGQRLRVLFASADRPAVVFRPEGSWAWPKRSRLVIPVENPGDGAVTLLLRLEDRSSRALTGKVAIAPRSSGNLAISLGAPQPRRWA
jgi:P pilus assembly chaperone PapD